jgi:type I protein arginine methyltransferase
MSVIQQIRPSVRINPFDPLLAGMRSARRDFPVWHFAMVNDGPRNAAIETSISALDLKGKTVVEIGSGSGLIALLFAKYGAELVVSCELNANLARVAAKIVAASEHAPRIKIINESSRSAIALGLLPRAPDVIFTETLDCGVVGEGFMPIAEDIRRLAGPQTVIMPRAVAQSATLIESTSLAGLNRANTACGFDLSLLNDYSTGNYFPVHAELHPHRGLSETHHMRTYSYLDCPQAEAVTARITRPGTVHGLLSWFAADFGSASVSNEPFGVSHWHQAFHPLPEDIAVEAGDELAVLIDDAGFAWVARQA